MARWLINARKRIGRKRRTKRPVPKGFRSWKAYMASIRPKSKGGPMARKRRKSRKGRRRKNPGLLANTPKRRRSRRATVRHVVRFRRNPGLRSILRGGPAGLLKQAMQGATDGAWIVAGKALTNALPSLVGLSQTGIMGAAVKAVAATVAGMLAGQFLGANAAKLVTAGGYAAIVEPFIKAANIPIISAALGDTYPEQFIGSYPDTLSAYPDVGTLGDGELDAAYMQ